MATLLAPGVVSTAAPEFATAFSPDDRRVFFNRTTADRSRITLVSAVRVGEGWLVNCGDAYSYHGYIDPHDPHLPLFGWLLKAAAAPAKVLRGVFSHSEGLRALLREHGDEVRLFCSHDPHEFDALQATHAT